MAMNVKVIALLFCLPVAAGIFTSYFRVVSVCGRSSPVSVHSHADFFSYRKYMGDSRRESPYNRINHKLLQAGGVLLGAEVGCFGCPSGPSN